MRTPDLLQLQELVSGKEVYLTGNETLHNVKSTDHKGYKYWYNHQGLTAYYFTSLEHLIDFFFNDRDEAIKTCIIEEYDGTKAGGTEIWITKQDPRGMTVRNIEISSFSQNWFDDFEIAPVQNIIEDGKTIEICRIDEDKDADFFSVYIHLNEGGCDCIADCETREQAEKLVDTLTKLLKLYRPDGISAQKIVLDTLKQEFPVSSIIGKEIYKNEHTTADGIVKLVPSYPYGTPTRQEIVDTFIKWYDDPEHDNKKQG